MIFALLLLGVFMGALDMGIVAPGLGVIAHGLGVRVAQVVWIVTVYSLVYALAMPIQGRLSDRHGRRRIFLWGVSLFSLGSLWAGLSPSLPLLLGARALQAVGGGGIVPVATAELGVRAGERRRGLAMGMVGATFGLATILGPVLGGAVLALGSWHWLFYLNVPIGVGIILGARVWGVEPRSELREPLDLVGAALTSLTVLALLLGIEAWRGPHGFEAGLILLALAFPLAVVTLRWEAATPHALLQPPLWQRNGLPLTYILALLTGIGMTAMLFVPLFAQRVFGVPIPTSGAAVLPMAVPAALTAALGGHLVDRWGGKWTLALGFLGITGGALLLGDSRRIGGLILSLAILGLGTGFTMGAPVNYLVFGYAPRSNVGTALALVGVFRSLGTTLGPVLLAAFLPSYSWLFRVAALSAGMGAVLAALLPGVTDSG